MWFSLLLPCEDGWFTFVWGLHSFFLSFFLSFFMHRHILMILSTYDISKVLLSEEDLKLPKELHPIFYGCFDWHRSFSILCFGSRFYSTENCHFSIKPSTAPSMDIGYWPEQLLCFQVCFPNQFVLTIFLIRTIASLFLGIFSDKDSLWQ